MGDIWPCRGPWPISWTEAFRSFKRLNFTDNIAAIMAAIASAESGLDLAIINDTPATGDYSVGAWQINYFGGLYGPRAAAFGTPCQLIDSGQEGQAAAAAVILRTQGYRAWSTYTSGAYLKYLHGFTPGPPGPAGPPGSVTIAPAPPAPAKDWAAYIDDAARRHVTAGGAMASWAAGIWRI